jgi:RimJ/RimL family protein N-acetyltransferase
MDRDAWQRAFDAYLADPRDFPSEVVIAWAKSARCLPIYCDWTHAFAVDEHGNVHANEIEPWPLPIEMNRLLPITPTIVKNLMLLNLALRQGAKLHPWLADLFPKRPSDAIDCTCKGKELPLDLICVCGGAGFLPNPGPPHGLAIRAPSEDDLEELFRLHVDSLKESIAATYGWDDADQRQRFWAAWEMRKHQRLLVDAKPRGETIVAAWHVEQREDRSPKEHFLTFVEVAPVHQGKGIGTWIVDRFVEEAFRANADATLRVLKVNPRARALYERLGFAVDGETATHFDMRRHIAARPKKSTPTS